MICASEDVGNADPQALVMAVNASLAVERVGMPEAVSYTHLDVYKRQIHDGESTKKIFRNA